MRVMGRYLAVNAFCLLALYIAVSQRTSWCQITVSLPEPHNAVILSVPDKSPALQVDLLHLKIDKNELNSDGSRRRILAADTQGWTFSSFLFPLDHKLDSKGLREEEWRDLQRGALKEGYKIEKAATSDQGPIAVLEYSIEEFRGQKVHQKNVFGYIVSADLAIDFHLSKIGYMPKDEPFLASFLGGMKLLENYEPDSKTQFGHGSMFYLRKDWGRAAQHYEKALTLEKQKRELPSDQWRVLVDNLGMAYGISGDLARAREALEFGVGQDPNYPMFHYNLACAYAETGDLDHALVQLRMAFGHRRNSIAGEGIPDPAKDDSFHRYVSDSRFKELERELCPSSHSTTEGFMCD
jgi:tetratricopeptide (TPR) repeat protein